MSIKVKICGITNWEDANFAINSGADALGFLVDIPPCAEKIDKITAKQIISRIPSKRETFLITTSKDVEHIIALCREVNPAVIQIIPDLKLKDLEEIKQKLQNKKIAKVIAVVDKSAINQVKKYSKIADILILDSRRKGQIGGIGEIHDWNISAEIVKECKIPVFLAGGLSPDNVAKAIKEVYPYGIDADTKLNRVLGKKDPAKVKKFIKIIKSFN